MIRTEYNAITDESIEIELTPKEVEQRLAEEAQAQAEALAKAEEKASAKAAAEAKLAALGLTTDDLKALGIN
jgi:membrane protein involved in colicin uptake